MYNLKIITSTVRPGRKGILVANWVNDIAKKNPDYQVELLDLAEINLPLMNEANHPAMQKYEHQHTQDWSAKINEADAFIFVTAEYNFGYPAPLRNALEYLFKEWGYKPAGIVSYGGISGGTRGANSLKSDLSTLSVVPVSGALHFPLFNNLIVDGEFAPVENHVQALEALLKELLRWTKALKGMREEAKA
jgi:NAD(P)H-dependent FMN reductase